MPPPVGHIRDELYSLGKEYRIFSSAKPLIPATCSSIHLYILFPRCDLRSTNTLSTCISSLSSLFHSLVPFLLTRTSINSGSMMSPQVIRLPSACHHLTVLLPTSLLTISRVTSTATSSLQVLAPPQQMQEIPSRVQWDSSSHPGPIQHFLFGPVTNASEATGIGSWVKIDEFDQRNGTWANAIMEAQNMTYEFNLPTALASGDYLLRSEMLALHGSQTLGGGQFYIGCAQLTITGTAGDSCSPSIQLPGAYNESDPSIYIPNFYNGFNISTYTAPGGAVAVCGTGSGSTAAVTMASAVPTSSAASAVAAVATSVAVSTSSAPTTLITATSAPASSTSVALISSAVSAVPVGTNSPAEEDDDTCEA